MAAGIPLGPYVLVRRLATGGMAEIFLARREGPEGFARDLVVKRILPHLAEDESFIEMFLEEARIAARLTHPNVVQVYDFGEADGSYYLAMELVRGVDLRALVERAARQAYLKRRPGALPPHHAAKIMSYACEGLAHAHALRIDGRSVGLVHRDMTPSNVLISFEGAVKVADFGIAKADTGRQRDDTRIGVVKGKYAYMSPEQARGERLDARSDLFNVGVLLFEAITGDTIFPHDDFRAAKMMSAAGRIMQPERIDQLPPELARAVKRALSPRPEDRYPDALSLRADLESYLRHTAEPSDQPEIGQYVRTLFPDVLEEDRRAPRAAGTVPETVAVPPSGTQPIDPDSPIELPALTQPTEDVTEEISLEPETAPSREHATFVSPPTRRARRGALVLGAAAAAAAILGIGGYFLFAGEGAGEPPSPDDLRSEIESARPPAPPPQPAPGELRVATDPAGLPVWVDGNPRGEAPLVLSLASGEEHLLELRVDGGVRASERVTLDPDERRELTLRMEELPLAMLRVVTVPPDATVTVDGEERGTTPLAVAVEPGEYEVQVALEGYEPQGGNAVLHERSETATLSFVLRELPEERTRPARNVRRPRGTGTLVIATTPWSEVYLGGRKLGTTPLSNVRLPAGRHTLTLRAEGKPPRRHPVVIRAGEETRVRLAL